MGLNPAKVKKLFFTFHGTHFLTELILRTKLIVFLPPQKFSLHILFSGFPIKVQALLQPINLTSKIPIEEVIRLLNTTLLQPQHSSLWIAPHLRSPIHFYTFFSFKDDRGEPVCDQ